jgi:hypothetical protein
MSETKRFDKDPQAVLDYGTDWARWLNDDTITASTWTVPDGITKDSDSHTATATVVWLSGGTAGKTYRVTNHIVTAAGRQDDRTLLIAVRER